MRRTFLTVVIAITAGVAAPALHAGSNVAGYAPAASDGHRTLVTLGAGYSPGPDASFRDWCRQPFPGGAGSHRLDGPSSADYIMSSDGLKRPGIRYTNWTISAGLDDGMGRSFGTSDFYSPAIMSDARQRMIETSLQATRVREGAMLQLGALRASGQRESGAHRSAVARDPDSSTFLMLLLGVGLMVLVVRRRI